MSGWLNKIRNDISNIVDAITYYETQIKEAKDELSLKGSIEKHTRDMPGIVEYRFYQLQEIEAILEYLNIELRKTRSKEFKKFLEHYNRQLSSRDAEKYVDGVDEVVDMQHLINEFALVRNRMQGIIKSLDQKSFSINNIVKLRAAGLDDLEL
jgi:uncharacterized protein YfdQ (DUF2303 family)